MWTQVILLVAGLTYARGQQTISTTVCPPLGVSMSIDGSGSMSTNAKGNGQFTPEENVEQFVQAIIGYIALGPVDSRICGNAFGSDTWNLFDCTDDWAKAKHETITKYSLYNGMQSATHMGDGAQKSYVQLQGLKSTNPNLARVMMMLSDGGPNPADQHSKAIQEAQKIKDDLQGTVYSVGFGNSAKATLEGMAGNPGNTCGADCVLQANGQSLKEIADIMANGFCKTLITAIPPTPSPTIQPCADPSKSNNIANKDLTWAGCDFSMCESYPWGNGSNELCVQYRDKLGVCAQVMETCSCSCWRCCDTPAPTKSPTKFPTPAPGEPTSSPTPMPTENPTLPLPDQPQFNFWFASLADWKSAEDVLKTWFDQLGYDDFQTEWEKMVDEGRVKVFMAGKPPAKKYATNLVFNVPFEAFEMQVWMPEKFYKTTTGPLGTTGLLASGLAVPLIGLLSHA